MHWKTTKYTRTHVEEVPKQSGLYAVVETRRVFGLLGNVKILYVGHTQNLRRRMREHLNPWSQHNVQLQNYVSLNSSLEFWFSVLPSEEARKAEKNLIRELHPSYNVVFNTKENGYV